MAKFWVMCEEGVIAAITTRGRRAVGTAMHYCSAEREVVGVDTETWEETLISRDMVGDNFKFVMSKFWSSPAIFIGSTG